MRKKDKTQKIKRKKRQNTKKYGSKNGHLK